VRHDFLFRRRLVCKSCRFTLIGETHKGFVYYRCQNRDCQTTAIREENAENAVLDRFGMLRLFPDEQTYFLEELLKLGAESSKRQEEMVASLELQLGQIESRISRLTDAFIDQLLDKDSFEQRKTALHAERRRLQDSLAQWRAGTRNVADELRQILERADTAYFAYKNGSVPDKRDLVDTITSNRLLNVKTLEITLSSPFQVVANRFQSADGSPRRDIHRTCNRLLKKLVQLIHNETPGLAEQPGIPSPAAGLPESRPAPKLPAWIKKKFQSGIYIPGRPTSGTGKPKKISDDTLPSSGGSTSA